MKTALIILGLVLLIGSGVQIYRSPAPTSSPENTELSSITPPREETGVTAAGNRSNPGKTIADRFPAPGGFERIPVDRQSFGYFLRHFPLRPHGSQVHLYNGEPKGRQDVHAAVLDLDVGDRDLQQCADAVMRLRAEYLRAVGREDEISFNFTNGFPAEYRRWKNGERIRVSGNSVSWVAGSPSSDAEREWKRYLTMVFSYAGTLSLEKELNPVAMKNLEIGDVFIQGGSPGHAVIVVDRAVNQSSGEVAFMLAQSYMPAQEMHVLKNPASAIHSPWYFVSQNKQQMVTPEWTFGIENMRRF